MPTPPQYKAPFLYDSYYHIIFKSIDGLWLFNDTDDYSIFLDRLKSFTHPLFEIWAYALLRNHVHFIIKTKAVADLVNFQALNESIPTQAMLRLIANDYQEDFFDAVIERQINSFMVSYVNTINNKMDKTGGFFQKPFRRVMIADEAHLEQAIIYVHANSQKHGLVKDFKQYPFHSFFEILQQVNLYVNTAAVIHFFGGKQQFIQRHIQQVEWFYAHQWPSSKMEG